MRAKLHRVHSPDVYELASWTPPTPDFSILLQLMVGPADGPGEESFELTLCTAGSLQARADKDGIVDAAHHLVVSRYDFGRLSRYLENRINACEAATWTELSTQIGRLGH